MLRYLVESRTEEDDPCISSSLRADTHGQSSREGEKTSRASINLTLQTDDRSKIKATID